MQQCSTDNQRWSRYAQSDESCDSGVRENNFFYGRLLSVSHCRDESGLVGCVGFGSQDLNSPKKKKQYYRRAPAGSQFAAGYSKKQSETKNESFLTSRAARVSHLDTWSLETDFPCNVSPTLAFPVVTSMYDGFALGGLAGLLAGAGWARPRLKPCPQYFSMSQLQLFYVEPLTNPNPVANGSRKPAILDRVRRTEQSTGATTRFGKQLPVSLNQICPIPGVSVLPAKTPTLKISLDSVKTPSSLRSDTASVAYAGILPALKDAKGGRED